MKSLFDNVALGEAIRRYLNVKDPKQAPAHLFTEHVLPVLMVGQLGSGVEAASEQWRDSSNTFAVDGLSGFGLDVIGPATSDPPAALLNDARYRVEGIHGQVVFNVAGALAANGMVMRLVLSRGGSGARIVDWENWQEVQTGRLGYNWALTGTGITYPEANLVNNAMATRSWSGLVPSGQTVTLSVGLFNPGTFAAVNFPASTTFNAFISARRSLDGGWPPP